MNVRVMDVSDYLHKRVELKNGLEGVWIGMYQNIDEQVTMHLIEYWGSDGKKQGWYRYEEFTFLD